MTFIRVHIFAGFVGIVADSFTALASSARQDRYRKIGADMGNIAWGVCGPFDPPKQVFQLINGYGFTEYRFDANFTKDSEKRTIDGMARMVRHSRIYGVSLKPIIQVPFAYNDRTDAGRYRRGEAADLYAQGFYRATSLVSAFPSILDWELGNELNLLVRDASGKPLYGRGWTAAEFDTAKMTEWCHVLRGMTDAIDRLAEKSGVRFRKTLNTTSTNFGFLDFAKNNGVEFSKISYHYYERLGTNPHKYWGKFDLFEKLDSYGLPVTVNELNAAEIYDTPYDDVAANKSLREIIHYFNDGTFKNLESVLFYTLFDYRTRKVPENRFGLLEEIGKPKSLLNTVLKAIN